MIIFESIDGALHLTTVAKVTWRTKETAQIQNRGAGIPTGDFNLVSVWACLRDITLVAAWRAAGGPSSAD